MKCPVSGDSSYLLMYSPQYAALLFPLFRRRVINNTACRQGGKAPARCRNRGKFMHAWTSRPHCCYLQPLTSPLKKRLACIVCSTETRRRSLLSFHQSCQLGSCFTKSIRTRHTRVCPRNTEVFLY